MSVADLRVYIDFKSPYAYLAIEPTRRLAGELGINVDWLPFVLDIPSYLGSARLNQSGEVVEQSRSESQWSGVKYAYYDSRRYANLRGMTIRGTQKIWDTNLAAIAMLWAKAQGESVMHRYLDAVYVPFWKRDLDVEDIAIVRSVLAGAGAQVTGFEGFARGEGRAENQRLQESAFNSGVFGVPTYEVAGERFFGREHLPRVRWLLTGRRGAAPDIAYELQPGDQVEPATERSLLVAIDPTALESYLAIGPVCAMADELGIEPTWCELSGTSAAEPPDPVDDTRGGRHRRHRADIQSRDQARYLPEGLTPGDVPARIESLLRERGITLSEVRQGRDMRSRGFLGTPQFFLGEEVFIGRQHLPLIRERLRGASEAG